MKGLALRHGRRRRSSRSSLAAAAAAAGGGAAAAATQATARRRVRRRRQRRRQRRPTTTPQRLHRRRHRLVRYGTNVRALRRPRCPPWSPRRRRRAARPRLAVPPRRGGVPTSCGGRRRAPAMRDLRCLRYDCSSVGFKSLISVVRNSFLTFQNVKPMRNQK